MQLHACRIGADKGTRWRQAEKVFCIDIMPTVEPEPND